MPKKARKTKDKSRKKSKDKDRKSKKKDRKSKKKVEDTPPISDVEEDMVQFDLPPEPKKKKRVAPTKESVAEGFDDIVEMINDEIKELRASGVKASDVKFLRTIIKTVKTLKTKANKVMKTKKKIKRKSNGNSGFLKPVRISKEMAKFTGWDSEELRSRVDVTKFICSYIKEHDLQNQADRRQIQAERDPKLAKLLNYDAKTSEKPLTYYSLQTHLKGHFIKDESK